MYRFRPRDPAAPPMVDWTAPIDPYTRGGQSCDRFRSRDELADRGVRGNVHSCYGPYPAVAGGEHCAGTVSFCDNCFSDHHADGWNTCPWPPRPEEDDSPPAGTLE